MGFCKGFCGIVFGKGVYPFLQGCATGGAGFIFCACTLTGYFLKAGVCCMLYVLEKARVFLLFASLLRGTLLDPLCDSTSGTRCRPPKQKAPIRFSPPLAGRGFSVLFFSRFSAICGICGIYAFLPMSAISCFLLRMSCFIPDTVAFAVDLGDLYPFGGNSVLPNY